MSLHNLRKHVLPEGRRYCADMRQQAIVIDTVPRLQLVGAEDLTALPQIRRRMRQIPTDLQPMQTTKLIWM